MGRQRPALRLGAGGMATVYLVYDLKHDRKVALKVLRPCRIIRPSDRPQSPALSPTPRAAGAGAKG